MMLAALFLKEPVTGQKSIGVVLGIAGAVLLIAFADSGNFVGQDKFSWDMPLVAFLVLTGAYVVSSSPARQEQNKNQERINNQ